MSLAAAAKDSMKAGMMLSRHQVGFRASPCAQAPAQRSPARASPPCAHASMVTSSAAAPDARSTGCSAAVDGPARRAAPVARAAVAEAPAQEAVVSSEVKGLGFYTGDDGFMYCDSLKVRLRPSSGDPSCGLQLRHRVQRQGGGGATPGQLCLRLRLRTADRSAVATWF